MPRRRRSLTDEEWRRVAALRDEWAAAAAAPADPDRAAAAFTRLYATNHDPAPVLVWTDAPLTSRLVCWLLVGFGGAFPFAALETIEQVVDTHPAWADVDAERKAAVLRALRPVIPAAAAPAEWQPPGPLSHGSGAYRRHLLTHLRGLPLREQIAISWREDRTLRPVTGSVAVERVMRRVIRRAVHRDLAARIERPFAPLGQASTVDPATPAAMWQWLDSAEWRGPGVTRRFDGRRDAGWVGRHEVYPSLGLVTYPPPAAAMLGLLGEISRSCGLWWALPGAVVATA